MRKGKNFFVAQMGAMKLQKIHIYKKSLSKWGGSFFGVPKGGEQHSIIVLGGQAECKGCQTY
jgi:hypothetical protein